MTPDDLKTFDCTLAREQRDREIADLRDLLAQQAARGDGLEARVTRYNELAGRDADRLAELRATLDAEKARADAAERRLAQLGEISLDDYVERRIRAEVERDAALAREARLREVR
jgi:hypothetical protein